MSLHTLQKSLLEKFKSWRPAGPRLMERNKFGVTLTWTQGHETFGFIADQLLYRVEMKEKIPPWVVVYRGGKTAKFIDNLAPSHPHTFRLQVQLKSTAIETLTDRAIQFYGNEQAVFDKFIKDNGTVKANDKQHVGENNEVNKETNGKTQTKERLDIMGNGDIICEEELNPKDFSNTNEAEDNFQTESKLCEQPTSRIKQDGELKLWLESQWSEEVWIGIEGEGTTAGCFCMAVKCGYLKQVQQMLEERPALINIINSTNGLTPLITAVRKGDLATVRYLVTSGADVNQKSAVGQTPLQLAVYFRRLAIADFLMEKGADIQSRAVAFLRVEHYAVDSGCCEVIKFIFERGGDVTVRDSNGWTPLFRAITQGAKLELIEDLINLGADIGIVDRAGLTLADAARILKDRRGNPQDAIIKLIDPQYHHEKAITHFTRLTKKISGMQSLLK